MHLYDEGYNPQEPEVEDGQFNDDYHHGSGFINVDEDENQNPNDANLPYHQFGGNQGYEDGND